MLDRRIRVGYRSIAPGTLVALLAVGCQSPDRRNQLPAGCVPVQYVQANSHTTCLVACVAMAANYLEGEFRFSEKGILNELRARGLDESRVSDVKQYLDAEGFYLVTLAGRLHDEPPTGLAYWLLRRGYPVICVINRQGHEPQFNHAVVVVGLTRSSGVESADKIHYFDPASAMQFHTDEVPAFNELWIRGQNAMMVVIRPPEGSAQTAGRAEIDAPMAGSGP